MSTENINVKKYSDLKVASLVFLVTLAGGLLLKLWENYKANDIDLTDTEINLYI